jgi:diguanylate cyclase (GGDEF)-like protein
VEAATALASAALGQDRQFQTRALAAMFGAGAVLGLISVLLPHGEGVNAVGWALNSSLGLPVAGALFVAGGRVPMWVLHVLLVSGAGMVALGQEFGDGGPASVATSFFYVWVALYAFWFFSPRAAAAHVTFDAAIFGAMLGLQHDEAGPAVWLLVMGTAVMVGIVVSLMHQQLIRVATIDPLTGLPTRHALNDAVTREIARSQRNATPLCLAIMDVDGLKLVNDQHGHQAGDRMLAEAARAWRNALRESDILVRFGGDEFVAVLPDCTPELAEEVLRRVRRSTAISCSAGLAWWQAGDTPADVLQRADAHLYEAKRSNRRAVIEPAAS